MRARVSILAFVLAAGACCAQTVRIGVLGLFHPSRIEVRSAGGDRLILLCEAQGSAVECASPEGVREKPGALDVTAFSLVVPGKIERRYQGILEITAQNGVLRPVVTMDLETAVAAAVDAESPASAPLEALKAQAVVTRSYYVAGRGRHLGFDFCDTTHCQFLREVPAGFAAAAEGTRQTKGTVLTWKGVPFAAMFSASCGGRSHVPDIPTLGYPYFAVNCPYCRREKPSACSYCVRAYGRWPNRRGLGAGHGVGLCQTGAAAMGREGSIFTDILRHYFPNTVLFTLDR